MGTSRRQYTDEFKREAVGLLASSGRPLSRIAEELGIAPARLRAWRNRGDDFPVVYDANETYGYNPTWFKPVASSRTTGIDQPARSPARNRASGSGSLANTRQASRTASLSAMRSRRPSPTSTAAIAASIRQEATRASWGAHPVLAY
jgi:Transposase